MLTSALKRHVSDSTSNRWLSHPHWRAGFVDGDGSIFISQCGGVLRPMLAIGVSLTAEGLVATSEFHSLYGGSTSISYAPTLKNSKHRPVCRWDLSGPAVFSALQDLDNALILKKPQSRLMLAHQQLFLGRNGVKLNEQIQMERRELKAKIVNIRAEAQLTSSDYYIARLLYDCPRDEQRCAYAAGFCDADAYFGCVPAGGGRFRYKIAIVQKNYAFLQALKAVIFDGRGANVRIRGDGVSCFDIGKERDVQEFCTQIRAYSIMKASQLDVIMSEPPGARAREVLMSMHGNQGKKICGRPQETLFSKDETCDL